MAPSGVRPGLMLTLLQGTGSLMQHRSCWLKVFTVLLLRGPGLGPVSM